MEKYFSIHRNFDDEEINIDDDLDREICDELNLEYNHTNEIGIIDYGHFYFSEGRNDPGIFGGQISISWLGFLNSVILYSNIRTGKVTKYDLEASLAWCMNHSVEFPKSSAILMYRLMAFFIRNKYYLKVLGHSSKRFYKTGYVNPYDKSRIIENETGFFHIDNAGTLKNYYPVINNVIHLNCNHDPINGKILNYVQIPAEVNNIGIQFNNSNISKIYHLCIHIDLVISEIKKHEEQCMSTNKEAIINDDRINPLVILSLYGKEILMRNKILLK